MTRNKNKTESSETALKQDVETSQQKDETEVKQHVETPIETEKDYVSPSVFNELVHLRLYEGLSFRQIAEHQNLSLSTVARALKGIDPLEASEEIDAETDGEVIRHASPSPIGLPGTSQESIISKSIPETYVVRPGLTAEEFTRYTKMKKEDMISEVLSLKSQNASLQGAAQTRRGNGDHSNTYSENYIDALGRLVDKLAMQKEATKIVDRMFPEEKKDNEHSNELSRRLDRIENKLDNSKQGRDPIEYILTGNQMRSDIEKNVQSQYAVGVQKGEADVKIEDMRAHERVDMERIRLEEKQLDHKLASEGKTLEQVKDLVKTVAEGPIGRAIENMGAAGADKLRAGPRIPQIDVLCTNCGNKFKVNPKLDVVTCNVCGSSLSKPKTTTEPQNPEMTEQAPEQPESKAEQEVKKEND